MTRRELFTEELLSWVGTMEVGGDNRGLAVERFQRAVDGKANGEPWCLAFLWHCILETERKHGKKLGILLPPSILFKTEHCLTMWNKSPKEMRIEKPEPGCIVVFQAWRGEVPTPFGHVEAIISVRQADKSFTSVGGNTSAGPGVNRNGGGVHLRQRSMNPAGSMRIKGYLRVWNELFDLDE